MRLRVDNPTRSRCRGSHLPDIRKPTQTAVLDDCLGYLECFADWGEVVAGVIVQTGSLASPMHPSAAVDKGLDVIHVPAGGGAGK